MTSTFGPQFAPAENDLRAAGHFRLRKEAVEQAMLKVLARLDERAEKHAESARAKVREVVGLDVEGDADEYVRMMTVLLGGNIKRHPTGPEQTDDFDAMLDEDGIGEVLRVVLALAEEAGAAPRAPSRPAPPRSGAPKPPAGRSEPARHAERAPAVQRAVAAPVRQAEPPRHEPPQQEPSRDPAPQRPVPPSAGPAPGAATASATDDEFFGVAVPVGKEAAARSIVADAVARASGEGDFADSIYLNGRGSNAWQPKLLRAAYEHHLAAAPEQEIVAGDGAGEPEAEFRPEDAVPAEAGSEEIGEAEGRDGVGDDVDAQSDGGADDDRSGQEMGYQSEERAEFQAGPEAETEIGDVVPDAVAVGHPAPSGPEEDSDEEVLAERADEDDDIDFGEAVFVAEAEDGPLLERVDEDDDRPLLTEPVRPGPRPAPTELTPEIEARAVPPVRPAVSGLMSANVAPRRPVAPSQPRRT